MSLPSFSAYPQAYATAAGEYLMMLPQMLEALLATADSEDGQNVAVDADWLDKVLVPLSFLARAVPCNWTSVLTTGRGVCSGGSRGS